VNDDDKDREIGEMKRYVVGIPSPSVRKKYERGKAGN
jgi:hypothetical protein